LCSFVFSSFGSGSFSCFFGLSSFGLSSFIFGSVSFSCFFSLSSFGLFSLGGSTTTLVSSFFLLFPVEVTCHMMTLNLILL